MIFHDPAFGFRDRFTGEIILEPEWTDWDYLLVTALQLIEDYSTDYGVPIWEVDEDADNVDVSAVKRIDRFEAAKDRITSRKNYKKSPGETFAPRVTLKWGEWPTFEEWTARQAEKNDSGPTLDSGDDIRYVQS